MAVRKSNKIDLRGSVLSMKNSSVNNEALKAFDTVYNREAVFQAWQLVCDNRIDKSGAGVVPDFAEAYYCGHIQNSGVNIGFFDACVSSKTNQKAICRTTAIRLARQFKFDAVVIAFYSTTSTTWEVSYVEVNSDVLSSPACRWTYQVGADEATRYLRERCSEIVTRRADPFKAASEFSLRSIFTANVKIASDFYDMFFSQYATLKNAAIAENVSIDPAYVDNQIKVLMKSSLILFFLQRGMFFSDVDNGAPSMNAVTKRVRRYVGSDIFADIVQPLLEKIVADPGALGSCKDLMNFTFDKNVQVNRAVYRAYMYQLSTFNFSLADDDADDRYIAVTTGVLANIFETLLSASVNDLEGNLRHKTGAVYTPDDIVAFMCRDALSKHIQGKCEDIDVDSMGRLFNLQEVSESWLPYMESEDILEWQSLAETAGKVAPYLNNLSILEPSVGAGAFVIGLMRDITRIRHNIGVLTGQAPISAFDAKNYFVQSIIHAVDINPNSVLMTRLRMWLSTLNEYFDGASDIADSRLNIVAGNSVIVYRQKLPECLEELCIVKRGFVCAPYSERAGHFTHYIEVLKKALIEMYGSGKLCEYANGEMGYLKDVENFADFAGLFQQEFSYAILFPEVYLDGGFDIVIGNPPYVKCANLTDSDKAVYRRDYSVFVGQADLLCVFYEQGFNLLKDGGVLSFITSNKWIITNYGFGLRRFFVGQTSLLLLIDFKEARIFGETGVDTEITVFRKTPPSPDHELVYCNGVNYLQTH